MNNILEKSYYDGDYVQRELVDGSTYGGPNFEVDKAFTMTGLYIGDPDRAKFLCVKRGIVPEYKTKDSNICSIGFCKKEQKWYGWSHRAIYGFGIGSKIKRGDCAWIPRTHKSLLKRLKKDYEFYDVYDEKVIFEKMPDGWKITLPPETHSTPELIDNDLPAIVLRSEPIVYEFELGRGAWTATTLKEAKIMAIDFANSVS